MEFPTPENSGDEFVPTNNDYEDGLLLEATTSSESEFSDDSLTDGEDSSSESASDTDDNTDIKSDLILDAESDPDYEPDPSSDDDEGFVLIEDWVREKYGDHPGFPRDEDSLRRYEKYVFPSLIYYGQPRDLPHGKYRKFNAFYHHEAVRSWFRDDNWKRYPDLLTQEEYEALSYGQKLLFHKTLEELAHFPHGHDDSEVYRGWRISLEQRLWDHRMGQGFSYDRLSDLIM